MSKHKKLSTRRSEPAVTRGLVIAVLGLLASLGFTWAADVSKETIGYIVVIASFLVPLVQAAWTRVAVTANAKVIARTTSAGQVVAGDAAVTPTGTVLAVRDPDGTRVNPEVYPVQVNPDLVA